MARLPLPDPKNIANLSNIMKDTTRRTLERAPALRDLGSFFIEKKWFFIALFVGFIVMQLEPAAAVPGSKHAVLTDQGLIILAMSIMATILFITEPIPLPTVALLIIVGQVLLMGIDKNVVAKSIMSDSVLFIMGSLMLAVAVVKQKLDKRIAHLIVSFTGPKTLNICFGISAVSGLLASVIGEHTVAAMMLPVAITLITLTSEDPKEVRNLAAVLLFSISYGASVAGIGTPSGGARNAIMIGYWAQFYPGDPKYIVSYVNWIVYAYPVFLIQLPFVTMILFLTFKPEYSHLSRAVVKLRHQIEEEGPMKTTDWVAIGVFFLTFLGWIFFSSVIGLGTIALMGAIAFLVIGLVRWEDMNSGVNWGVVLLYGAAISLGVQMKDTGAAAWLADNFLTFLKVFGADTGVALTAAISLLTTAATNLMSNGAAVAVLGPIVLPMADAAGESPLIIGYVTAVSSAFAYLTVIGTPACTIVYSSGYLKTTDFLKVGYRMVIMSTIMLLLASVTYWPMLGG